MKNSTAYRVEMGFKNLIEFKKLIIREIWFNILKNLNLDLVGQSSKNNVCIKILNPIAWLGRSVKFLKVCKSRLFFNFQNFRLLL